jgi:PHD/YefM family antitoxin component YafN of YafNO toxin-antitoxin module
MLNVRSLGNVMDALVPISRFNKGEASKIFDEVREFGCKVVVKNNTPTCVMLSPEKYREILEMLEDEYLVALVEERERNDTGKTYSFEEVLAEQGVTQEELDNMDEPVYGVDFA